MQVQLLIWHSKMRLLKRANTVWHRFQYLMQSLRCKQTPRSAIWQVTESVLVTFVQVKRCWKNKYGWYEPITRICSFVYAGAPAHNRVLSTATQDLVFPVRNIAGLCRIKGLQLVCMNMCMVNTFGDIIPNTVVSPFSFSHFDEIW